MAKHEVVIHENTGATKEHVAYLGRYIAKETVKEPSFALAASQKAGMSAIQFRSIIDGVLQAFEELEKEGLVRIHTDLGVICAVITGSFPTADAAPDPEKNKLELCLRLADDIKLSLADVVPHIAQDDSLTKLRVDNVMDLEMNRPYNLIHGLGVFRVAGYNMVLDDEGAGVHLLDGHGVTYPVVVDEVVSKQLFKAHVRDLIEGGDYKLVVKSRAGDAEGPLQTAFRKVKYMRIEPEGPHIYTPTEQMPLSSTGSLAFTGKELPTDVAGWSAASPVCELREDGEVVDMIELGPVADFDDISATGFTLKAADIVSGLFTEKEREIVPGQEYELRFTATIDSKSLAVPFTAHG